MKDDVKNPRKFNDSKRVQKDHHGKTPRYQTAKVARSHLFSCKILLSISLHFLAFMKLRIFLLLLISGKWIASLKKIISAKILNLTLKTEELTSLEEIL